MLPLWVHTVQGSTHSTPTAFQIEKKPYAQSFGKFPIRCFILSIGERKKRHTNMRRWNKEVSWLEEDEEEAEEHKEEEEEDEQEE